jgi:tRNA/rRNA methyltransferase
MDDTKATPIIVLVETQLGENIGMCARAMLNCGIRQLRLVRPRDGWPNKAATITAADADLVLDGTEVFEDIDSAVTDCQRVYAATARQRSLNIPGLDLREAVTEIVSAIPAPPSDPAAQRKVAIVFGPEASGLDNETLSRADRLVHFPTNPDFSSLNLAQAVLLFAWEWWQSTPADRLPANDKPPAKREETNAFLKRLEQALDDAAFFLSAEQKPYTLRTLRTMFTRINPTTKEVRMLQGALTSLTKDR